MICGRYTFAACGGLAAIAGLACLAARVSPVNPPVRDLVPGKPYAVQVQSGHGVLDLEFGTDTRYILIVSSLGDASRVYPVSLKAEPVPKATWLPIRPLEPLSARRLRAFPSENRRRRRLASLSREAAGQSTPNPPEIVRDFHLHVTDGDLEDSRQYVQVTGRVVAEGERVRVYFDQTQPSAAPASGIADEIVRLLDDEILPRLERHLGTVCDVDGDGKLAVLLTPWLSRLQDGRTSLNGFVRGADFRSDLEPPFSNRCDMLYLNSNVPMDTCLRTLLAHELAHAICFSQRRDLPEEEDWLNEAIAHLAENPDGRTWDNLHYRLARYLDAPRNYPLVVGDYYRAGWWRNHGCRGATYLFLRWCVDQYGDELLPQLIRSPSRGTRNLEQATGVRFEELYRRWTLAVVQAGDRYASLDLYAPLDGWGLAGPRMEAWDVESRVRQIKLRGTATAFLDVESTGKPGIRRIRLAADHGTRLQVSVFERPVASRKKEKGERKK